LGGATEFVTLRVHRRDVLGRFGTTSRKFGQEILRKCCQEGTEKERAKVSGFLRFAMDQKLDSRKRRNV